MAIKKVNGISTHQNLIFKRKDSGIIHAKKVKQTTVISAPIDLDGKFVRQRSIKLDKEVSWAVWKNWML